MAQFYRMTAAFKFSFQQINILIFAVETFIEYNEIKSFHTFSEF